MSRATPIFKICRQEFYQKEVIFINTAEQIIKSYYELHEKPISIAKVLNVNPSYITKIIKKDSRYTEEKEYRTSISSEQRKKQKADWIRNKRQKNSAKQLDEFVKLQHQQASKELSYTTEISDLAFAKWNRNMFTYDKKSTDLILKKGFKYACDVPKRLSNVIHPSFIKPLNKYF